MTFSLLDRPVQFLKGVGPARAAAFARAGIHSSRELLFTVPRRYDDASTIHPIEKAEVGMEVTVLGSVRTKGVLPTRSGLRIFQAVLQDETGMITSSWPGQPWMDRKVQVGDLILATGVVRFYNGRQLQPRETTILGRGSEQASEDAEDAPGRIYVTYPATEELPQWVLRKVFDANLDALLDRIPEEEYLDAGEREGLGLLGLQEALTLQHRPASLDEVESGRRRLAYDELFFLQLVQAQARWRQSLERPGIAFVRSNELVRPMHEALPFTLTNAQAQVIREIYDDMTSSRRMGRLLQGDVGSGKTVVALFAMLLAVESGYQAALMAPTEILAEQHARTLGDMLAAVDLGVDLITGRMPAAARRAVEARVASGASRLVVGTHALIQDSVGFERLGLAIIDEQHRFGVRQRMALGERGEAPDVLVMSATPIPRSLAMALYGDLDLSILSELPPGRQPIRTLLSYPSKRDEVYALVRQHLDRGHQAYIVYPLVDDSEVLDLPSATQEIERLGREVFPERRLGLLHGQLSGEDKYRVMREFLAGELDILVATSVIEVGIDVPNATFMLVEHAERFGLSQLHQLRGRVGRGSGESVCVLIAAGGDESRARLKVLRDHPDGFAVAREDLLLRGQGDFFGAQQHGRDPLFRFADLTQDEGLLAEAQRRARAIVDRDPELRSPQHATIKRLLETRHAERLKLFEVG